MICDILLSISQDFSGTFRLNVVTPIPELLQGPIGGKKDLTWSQSELKIFW